MAKHSATGPLKLVTHRTKARYGWNRDMPDARDHIFAAPLNMFPQGVPPAVDLRPHCPAVYDQGQLGSCTANAIGGALEFDRKKQGLPDFIPSRLFIYYNERVMEGTVGSDAGAQIRDGIKSIASQGDCPESEWPYDGSPARPDGTFPPGHHAALEPPPQCYRDAIKHAAISYF